MDVRELGNLPNSPELQNKMAELTQQFPTPRLQTDDGNQEIADLHAREDLLLDNYSWIDRTAGQGADSDRAGDGDCCAAGLAGGTSTQAAPLMTGDQKAMVHAPLTSGFARTAYELELERGEGARAAEAEEREVDSAVVEE